MTIKTRPWQQLTVQSRSQQMDQICTTFVNMPQTDLFHFPDLILVTPRAEMLQASTNAILWLKHVNFLMDIEFWYLMEFKYLFQMSVRLNALVSVIWMIS